MRHDETAQRRGNAQSYSNSEGHEASLTLHSVSLHAGAETQAGSPIWPYIHVHLSICGCSVGGVTNRLSAQCVGVDASQKQEVYQISVSESCWSAAASDWLIG